MASALASLLYSCVSVGWEGKLVSISVKRSSGFKQFWFSEVTSYKFPPPAEKQNDSLWSQAPFIGRMVVPSKRVTFPARSTLASVYMRKNLTPLHESRAGRACSCRLALTELTQLGEPKCLYGEKLAQLGGAPGHRKKVTRLGWSPFQPRQHFVSYVNSSSSFVTKCRKRCLAQGSSGRRVALLPGRTFFHINGPNRSKIVNCMFLQFQPQSTDNGSHRVLRKQFSLEKRAM